MTDEMDTLDPYVRWIADEARRPVSIDAAARRRLLDAIRSEPLPRRAGAIAWLLEPRHLALPPLATALLAAGLVGIGILGGSAIHRDGRQSTEQPRAVVVGNPQLPDSVAARAIKFVLIAPQAARVSLVGDFNGWDTSATPMTATNKDGAWTVFVPLRPGLHTYAFVVDGKDFVADPSAPIAPDDGYGHRNSVVVVGRGGSKS